MSPDTFYVRVWSSGAANMGGGLLRRLDISFQGRADAEEIAIAVNIVDSVDGRPIFVDPEGAGGKARGLARIGSVPFPDKVFNGMRSVL